MIEQVYKDVVSSFPVNIKNPSFELVTKMEMQEGGFELENDPDMTDPRDTSYLEGVTFRVPKMFAQNELMLRAYFAHEISHLELYKRPSNVSLMVAKSIASQAMKKIEHPELSEVHGLNGILTRVRSFFRTIKRFGVYIPVSLYGNQIKKIIDKNAMDKGFEQEISELREHFPLRIFK